LILNCSIILCWLVEKKNSVAFNPQTNYTNLATATFWRKVVPTFVDRGVSRGQRGGSPTAVNLSFLDRSRYFSFKYLLIYPNNLLACTLYKSQYTTIENVQTLRRILQDFSALIYETLLHPDRFDLLLLA
jgi:hypothetical protein